MEASWLQELTIIGDPSAGLYPFDSVLLLSKVLVDMNDLHLARRLLREAIRSNYEISNIGRQHDPIPAIVDLARVNMLIGDVEDARGLLWDNSLRCTHDCGAFHTARAELLILEEELVSAERSLHRAEVELANHPRHHPDWACWAQAKATFFQQSDMQTELIEISREIREATRIAELDSRKYWDRSVLQKLRASKSGHITSRPSSGLGRRP